MAERKESREWKKVDQELYVRPAVRDGKFEAILKDKDGKVVRKMIITPVEEFWSEKRNTLV